MSRRSALDSIRARLLLGLMVLVALTSAGAGVITYRRVLDETSRLFDYQLRQMALSLRDQATTGPGIVLPSHPDNGDFVVQIWDLFGAQVYRSRPELPLINRAVLGYADMPLAGERWRVYSLATVDAVIQVAQPWRVREQLARAAAVRILVRLLLLLLAMAAAVVWIVGRGLAPLRRLAAEVERRDVHTLSPIAAPDLPSEAAPLVEELNRLLSRLGEAFRKQRAFVADAAHELRSPLTALSLQLQLLDRAPDDAARSEARAKLGAAIERATHLAGQLLTLARSEPEGAQAPLVAVSLAECARAGIADVSTLATERGVDLSLDATTAPALVAGDADSLRILTRNLVDNATRHSPRGAKVAVQVLERGADAEHRILLTVEDNGPGIPADERTRVFDRFHRRADAAEGSGLGLAIVRAIADRHGAAVSLDDSVPHGLRVTVSFPPAGA